MLHYIMSTGSDQKAELNTETENRDTGLDDYQPLFQSTDTSETEQQEIQSDTEEIRRVNRICTKLR